MSSSEGEELDFEGSLSDFVEDDDPISPSSPSPSQKQLGAHLKTETEWSELGISRPLLKAINASGYKNPTPIQCKAIPAAIEGRDVLGMAETGSGKTLAFLIPCVERLLHSPVVRRRRLNGATGEIRGSEYGAATKVLILLPTRELAEQCYATCEELCRFCPVTRCLLRGASSTKEQEAQMRRQPDIVIATPGRCLDLLLNSASVHMNLLDILVFDEADRLVEMGFKNECLAVVRECRSKDRQTLLFSATLASQSEELAQIALGKNPVRILPYDKETSIELKAATNVKQSFVKIHLQEDRLPTLLVLLDEITTTKWDKRIVIFFNTKKDAHIFAVYLNLLDIRLPPIAELHGNLTADQRIQNYNLFQKRERNILVASDVAGRGLDLEDVELVINADMPSDVSKYIHRIGRTGRKGLDGESITIFNQQTERSAAKNMLKQSGPKQKEPFKAKSVSISKLELMREKVALAAGPVKEFLNVETTEREVRIAERNVTKQHNIEMHYDEISSRPPKRWLPKNRVNTGKQRAIGK